MTEKQLEAISQQASKRWPLLGVRILHRIGELYPGTRLFCRHGQQAPAAAFESADFIMDFPKAEPFLEKTNHLSESRWIESRKSDIDALERWQE